MPSRISSASTLPAISAAAICSSSAWYSRLLLAALSFTRRSTTFCSPDFEIELLAIDRHLRLLGPLAGFGQLGFELGDVRLAGPDLLGAALQAVAELGQC